MVLMGDFAQLPPVKYKAMFEVKCRKWLKNINSAISSSSFLDKTIHKSIQTGKEFVFAV